MDRCSARSFWSCFSCVPGLCCCRECECIGNEGSPTEAASPITRQSTPSAEPEFELSDPSVLFKKCVVKRPGQAPGTDSNASLSSPEEINMDELFEKMKLKPKNDAFGAVKKIPDEIYPKDFKTVHRKRMKRVVTQQLLEAGLIDDFNAGQTDLILSDISNWKFNSFIFDTATGGRCLPLLGIHLFERYGLREYFNLDMANLWKLFLSIEDWYDTKNPYHNSIHATDVTQAMHVFLQQPKVIEYMEPIEIVAALLAATAHDLDHPGFDQDFLKNTSHYLSFLYQNSSVLERHHWRSAMSCLRQSGLFDHMPEVYDVLAPMIRDLVMATDITQQSKFLDKFKEQLDVKMLDMTKAEHRLLVLQIALKCADISNPCRPWNISYSWTKKVCEEFFRQGKCEGELGLAITPMYNPKMTSIPVIQSGFFEHVVMPLVKEWHRFLNNSSTSEMLLNVELNLFRWQIMADRQKVAACFNLTPHAAADAVLIENDNDYFKRFYLETKSFNIQRKALPAPLRNNRGKEFMRSMTVPLLDFRDMKFYNEYTPRHETERKENGPTLQVESLSEQINLKNEHTTKHEIVDKIKISAASRAESDGENMDLWKIEKSPLFLTYDSSVGKNATTDSVDKPDLKNKNSINSGDEKPQSFVRQLTFAQPFEFFQTTLVGNFYSMKVGKSENSLTSLQTNNIGDIKKYVMELKEGLVTLKFSWQFEDKNETDEKLNIKTDTSSPLTSDSVENTNETHKLVRELCNKSPAADEASASTSKTLQYEPILMETIQILQAEENVEKDKTEEVPPTLPQMLAMNEWWKRRGSAPVSETATDLRVQTVWIPVTTTCQQSFAKEQYGAPEDPIPQLHRRSSLPVEDSLGLKALKNLFYNRVVQDDEETDDEEEYD